MTFRDVYGGGSTTTFVPWSVSFLLWLARPHRSMMLAARRLISECARRASFTRRLSARAWRGRAGLQGSEVTAARGIPQPLVVGCASLRLSRVCPSKYQVPLASALSRGYAGITRRRMRYHLKLHHKLQLQLKNPLSLSLSRPAITQSSQAASSLSHHGRWYDSELGEGGW